MRTQERFLERRLPCGARVLFVVDPAREVTAVSAWFDAGYRYDPRGREGLAHLFEHLLTSMCRRLPSEEAWVRELETLGIAASAQTNAETAEYVMVQSAERTAQALRLLLEALREPVFTGERLAQEAATVRQEAGEHVHNLLDRAQRAMWKGSAFDTPVFGSAASVRRITLADVTTFYRQHYAPQSATFVIVCNGHVEKLWKVLLKGWDFPKKAVRIFVPSKVKAKGRVIVKEDGDVTTVCVAYPASSMLDTQGYVAMNVLRSYLANHWSSVVLRRLRREERLVYWIEAESAYFLHGGMTWLTFACEKANVRRAIAIIDEEIARVAYGEVDTEVLKRVKAMHALTTRRQMADAEQTAWSYGWEYARTGVVMPTKTYLRAVEKIDVQDIRKILKNT